MFMRDMCHFLQVFDAQRASSLSFDITPAMGTFTPTLVLRLFVFKLGTNMRQADGRTDRETDRRTDVRARSVMQPIRMAA